MLYLVIMWTENETNFLLENYAINGPSYCSQNLGKDYACVRVKASRMGLKMTRPSNHKKTHEEYEMDIMERNLPIIPLEKYETAQTPITHQCFEGHTWKAPPTRILSGKGCPLCASYRFNVDIPAILYYIYIEKSNLQYYKIGITNSSIEKRFGPDYAYIRVIQETLYDRGGDALAEERRILKKYSEHRQNIPELLNSGGHTELFEFDVLGLDN